MKIKAVDKSSDEVHLDDPDDPASLTMDSSSVLGDTSRWASMEPLNTVEGGYLFTSTCRKGSDSLVLEIDLEVRFLSLISIPFKKYYFILTCFKTNVCCLHTAK